MNPEHGGGVRRYVVVLAVLGTTALTVALASLAGGGLPESRRFPTLAVASVLFIAAFLALQRMGFTYLWRGNRHRVVLDEVVVFQGFLLLPPPLVVVLVAAASLLEEGLTRRPLMKGAFNLSQNVLGATLGWAALLALAPTGTPLLLAALPAAFLYPLTSHALTAGVFARIKGRRHVDVLREGFLTEGLFEGAVGAGAGVALAVFWAFHPATLLALAPFVYLTHRYGVLSALADRELAVRKRVGEVGHELVGTTDVEAAADRMLRAVGEVLPTCGRAELTLHEADGPRRVSRDFAGGPPKGATPVEQPVPGRGGLLGVLRVYPRRGTPALDAQERELLPIIAAQAGAAMEATRALAASERARARLDTYLKSAGDAVLVVHEDGCLAYLNPAAESLFEDACAGQVRHRVDALFAEPHLLQLGEDAPALVETTAFNCSGTRQMVVEVHAAHLPERGPEGGGTLLVVRDVTERKRLEEESAKQRDALARQEKLSALGTLVAGVAHEINNPVVYMRGAAELADMDLAEAAAAAPSPPVQNLVERARRALSRLVEGVDRVDRITHSLKAVARQGNGERRPENLNSVCEDVTEVVRVGLPKRVHLRSALTPDLPRVHANASELHQVVLNLVKNAVDALADGGGNVTLRTRREAGELVLTVEDDGPGIPETVQRRLFEPFFTTKISGTGLGLSLCKGIAEAHGGDLTVETAPGEGTIFSLRLPLAGSDDRTLASHPELPQVRGLPVD